MAWRGRALFGTLVDLVFPGLPKANRITLERGGRLGCRMGRRGLANLEREIENLSGWPLFWYCCQPAARRPHQSRKLVRAKPFRRPEVRWRTLSISARGNRKPRIADGRYARPARASRRQNALRISQSASRIERIQIRANYGIDTPSSTPTGYGLLLQPNLR